MPKSRKRKKKVKKKKTQRRNYTPYKVVKQKLFKLESPILNDIPFEQRLKAIVELGKNSKIKYEEAYKNLTNYINEYDPLYLCSFCAYYFVSEEEGIDKEAIDGQLDFPPFFLEILQCLSLFKTQTISKKPLNESIDDFVTTIKQLNKSQMHSYFALAENAKNKDDFGSITLRAEMMAHTLAVRNWAYIHQMENITYELIDLATPIISKSIEFKLSNLLKIISGIVSLTENKLNTHLRKTRSFITSKNFNDAFDKYEKSFPKVFKSNKEQREKIWNHVDKNLQNLKVAFLAHSDYYLQDIYTHNVDDIYNYFDKKITKFEINNILNQLSHQFGELSETNKDHIFLNNPIHSKPFINLNDGNYFSAVPHMLSHTSLDIIESFIPQTAKSLSKYNKNKGKYLEEKVEKLFTKAFPKAQIFSGSQWSKNDEDKIYENDLILLLEEFAIIIECKSGSISSKAKRGTPARLIDTIKKLVVEPSEQAIRFQNFLKQNPKKHIFKTKSGKKNSIDSSKIKYYIPLGITLSNLGAIGCNLKKLISANIISHKLEELAPSISYTDLENIFEILSTQAEKIHYLSRRREFEAHINFQGDEMDLFGFYLDNGFNIGEAEFEKDLYINLTLKSKEIDPYFIGTHRNKTVKKPQLKKTKYWTDILKRLELTSNNWLASSYILLNLPIEDQRKFETNLKKLKTMIRKGKCKQKHNYVTMNFGPKRREYILVGYPYININTETRNSIINNIVYDIEKQKNIRGFLIMGYNMNSENYPYSVMAGNLNTNLFDSLDQ